MLSARDLCIILVLLSGQYVFAVKYESRCKMVRELVRAGMHSDSFLGQWVCLIEQVSSRDTNAFHVSPSNRKYYGLFQIPSRKDNMIWCNEKEKPGGECNIPCSHLLDDDLRDDTMCADKIFKREGFKFWPIWSTRCKNNDFFVREIFKCPDVASFSPVTNLSRYNLMSRHRRRFVRKSNYSNR